MRQLRRANHTPPEHLTDGLVTQTDPEQWDPAGERFDHFHRNTCFIRRTRPRRNKDSRRLERALDLFDGDFVVAAHFDLLAQLTEILHEVVGKRIVVVDDQKHVKCQWSVVSWWSASER